MRIETVDINSYEKTDYIYVGHPTKYSNPYSYDNGMYRNIYSKEVSLTKYKEYLDSNPKIIEDLILELKVDKIHKIGTWNKSEANILRRKIKELKHAY